MRVTPAILLVLAGLTGACAPAVPAEPTWIDDVRPILAANCIRCHSPPYIGGVPHFFRLDIFDNDRALDPLGDEILGVDRMQSDVELRANDGTMPPRIGLGDRQGEIITAWLEAGAPKGERASNAAPTMTLVGDPAIYPDGVGIHYQIEDGDDDIVTGIILADGGGPDPIIATNELFVGNGSVGFRLSAGTYELTAELDDGSDERTTVELGMVTVP